MILNDIKQTYPIFKWFKENYSILNKATQILLCGHPDKISLYYNKDSEYYLLYGEIVVDNVFSQWLNGKRVFLTLPDIVLLHKCLKKNVVNIDYDDDYFSLTFTNKEDLTHVIKLVDAGETDFCNKTERILSILSTTISFDATKLSSEILTPYEKDGELVFTHKEGYEKILEHPSKKFICTQKDATYSLSFSDRYENIRYVAVNSYTEKIKLTQLFATI